VTEQLPLRYVSPTQINALIPFDLGPGSYNLVVATPTGTSAEFHAPLSNVAPAIYSQNATGTGPALVFDTNFQPVTQVSSTPLILYASGLGATNPPGSSAGGNAAEPFNRTIYTPRVRIGGVPAQILFSGLAPGLPGIYQLNVLPSSSTPPGDNSLSLDFFIGPAGGPGPGGLTTLPVPEGSNTANLTGSLTPTHPLDSTVLGYSPLMTAAKWNAAFDILPGAQPFNLVATCPGGSMTIAFDPGAGTWQATANVPEPALRSGDFSGATNAQGNYISILDFINNNTPFPGNIIPQSRLDSTAAQAISAIPLPNYTGSIANVNFLTQGAIPPGGHFVVSDSSNSNREFWRLRIRQQAKLRQPILADEYVQPCGGWRTDLFESGHVSVRRRGLLIGAKLALTPRGIVMSAISLSSRAAASVHQAQTRVANSCTHCDLRALSPLNRSAYMPANLDKIIKNITPPQDGNILKVIQPKYDLAFRITRIARISGGRN
jgi:uncharacterized protein (TIGR03437 family)